MITVIKKTRVSEKASMQAADINHAVYTFIVDPSANKGAIKRAVKEKYKVTPIKINLIKSRAKKIVYRGHYGYRPGFKKALVFLKKGDKIENV
ncbi:MAG: 50S ribosomal protein L23 [Candidatus Vogelbacteria bacterium]|nr:50S ribosomal protein L23 [Candidatus Vogelbacteria bacterium]